MVDLTAKISLHDEISSIVDSLVADPSQVESIKKMLLGDFATEARPVEVERSCSELAETDDMDMWDNVPI